MFLKNKKYYFLLFIVYYFMTVACSSNDAYKQVMIVLNNNNGVPFYHDEFDYYIDGFEVDNEDMFYFLGGDNAILACFKDTQLIYRKQYFNFKANQIYTINNRLYVFDYMYEKNNLYVLDKANGNIINEYQNIIKNRVNSFLFRDTSLIIEVFNYQDKINMKTEIGFVLFNLNGEFDKQVKNIYNVSEEFYDIVGGADFLGQWEDNYVFWDYDLDNRKYVFLLKNEEGKILATKRIGEEIFGKPFYGNPIEHRKLRNGVIYILGRKGDNAVITKLLLSKLF